MRIFYYLKKYSIINTTLIGLSLIQYYSFIYKSIFLNLNAILILRNILLIKIIDYGFKNKKYINNDKNKTETINNFYYLCMCSFFDSIVIYNFYNTFYDTFHYEYIIPYIFLFELFFDFLHYITHILMHKIPFLYKFHKIHHSVKYPKSILTFKHHPVDYIFTNVIPMLFCIYVFKCTNLLIFIIYTYKTHIEIGGHCGKINNTPSFPICPLIPKYLNISLYTIDHDNHHTKNNCNYSKRFKLWDKIFNTAR